MGIRVAVTDDDSMVRSALRRHLAHEPGFTFVGEATDGLEAVALVQSTEVDVLLLDFAMPRLNGLGALPQVRTLSPRTQVVMFSSFPDNRQRKEAMDLGAFAYLAKGCDPEELVATIMHAAGAAAAEAR